MTQATPDGSEIDHRPPLTSLSDVFRNPREAPLATIAATFVLLAAGYQTYHVATTRGWLVGALVAMAFLLAYQIARRYWAIQNAVVAAQLARLELDADCDEDESSEAQAGSRRDEDGPTDT